MGSNLMTPEQAAKVLQVHHLTVLKLIKNKKLRAIKLGRVYRIRESDFDSFLDKHYSWVVKAISLHQNKNLIYSTLHADQLPKLRQNRIEQKRLLPVLHSWNSAPHPRNGERSRCSEKKFTQSNLQRDYLIACEEI